MAATLVHRGPDDAGSWTDSQAGIALGFRRLSIIDLSEAGHQPMTSASGRYVVVLNGEIYNFLELRARLEALGMGFHGHSDTEVLLGAFDQWGVVKTLKLLNGMFAFAVWDRLCRCLTLARDRMGEKPLYYGWLGNRLLFASELKGIIAHPKFRPEIDRGALMAFFRHSCIPAPLSIYNNVAKLSPGFYLAVSGGRQSREVAPTPYWSLADVVSSGLTNPSAASFDEAVDCLNATLSDSIRMRMLSDVPLGAFLSGGIDSSAVVALMQANSSRAVRTFSIGFEESDHNEAPYAKAIASHLGTEHTELYVSSEQAMAVIPRLGAIYDEPFADSSQIPTVLVSELARRDVTVALSGDGGDELFGGYDRYAVYQALRERLARYPFGFRRAIAAGLTVLPPRHWDRIWGRIGPSLPGWARGPGAGVKVHRLAATLRTDRADALYLSLMSHWDPAVLIAGASEPLTRFSDRDIVNLTEHPILQAMALDSVSYLPEDILVKVDRASMSVGLEARLPLLDHRVIEFAWSLPLSHKVNPSGTKQVLRKVLDRYVPSDLVNRPKMGFGVPIGDWLKGQLRDWAEDLLSESRLRSQGILDPAPVRSLWSNHLAGHQDGRYLLWDVLMFEAWLEDSQSRPSGSSEGHTSPCQQEKAG